MPSNHHIDQYELCSNGEPEGASDLLVDRAASGSVLLSARSDEGRRFLARIHGSFWNGRAAFFQDELKAEDMIAIACAMGLIVHEYPRGGVN